MDTLTSEFVRACSFGELKAKGRLVYDQGPVLALDNRCPHISFPLERGSIADGILTCRWHHARFDLASGCTFDLWADDVPTCPVEVRESGEVWVRPIFGHADPTGHWRRRLQEGLAHNLDLVIAKAVRGQLAAGVPVPEIIRQVALFGLQNRDGWGVGLTILTAYGNLLPVLPEEETYLALLHGAGRVAADCEGQPTRRGRTPSPVIPIWPCSSVGCGVGSGCGTERRSSAPCSQRLPPERRLRPWPTFWSPPRRIASMPMADICSTSSTRPSNAWT
ncbi:Rieske (2Fe-2S) protein [Microvirga aerilata]|uniref:Rieske (2Fe-2S) protein n=1 Tax=Microvirga aerilata TaxID=670292 RepID=UPI00362DB6EB